MNENEIIDIINENILSPDVIFDQNKNFVSFNGFENSLDYGNYLEDVKDGFEAEIKAKIKSSKSRINAVLYVKELKLHLHKIIRYITTIEDNNLNESENLLYQHSLKNNLKMASEFLNIKNRTFYVNKGLLYNSDNTVEYKNLLVENCSDFVKEQYFMMDDILDYIELYDEFVQNITVDDFKHKDDFFEYNFNTLILSDKVKLTDKDIKIETLDIRQTALLFNYLQEAKLFLKYNKKGKAYFAYYLTGHSESNIRTNDGFGAIDSIKKDRDKPKKYKEIKLYNLNSVKTQVENLLKLIENDIEKYGKICVNPA